MINRVAGLISSKEEYIKTNMQSIDQLVDIVKSYTSLNHADQVLK